MKNLKINQQAESHQEPRSAQSLLIKFIALSRNKTTRHIPEIMPNHKSRRFHDKQE